MIGTFHDEQEDKTKQRRQGKNANFETAYSEHSSQQHCQRENFTCLSIILVDVQNLMN